MLWNTHTHKPTTCRKTQIKMKSAMFVALLACGVSAKQSFLWTQQQEEAAGIEHHVVSALPSAYVRDGDLPESFTWGT